MEKETRTIGAESIDSEIVLFMRLEALTRILLSPYLTAVETEMVKCDIYNIHNQLDSIHVAKFDVKAAAEQYTGRVILDDKV
jgi:hypothetical protein